MMKHILLVESSDLADSTSLNGSLQQEGYWVDIAHTPEVAVEKTQTIWPNVIVFNHIAAPLPIAHFCDAIDQTKLEIPYLVVGHNITLPDTLSAHVFSANGVIAWDHAIEQALREQVDRFIRLPNLTIDQHHSQVLRDDQQFSLTPKEFKLLHLLVDNQGQVLSRKQIMREVWETDYMGDTRTLDVHIRWIREKIEENPSNPKHLITIRGIGYRFLADPE